MRMIFHSNFHYYLLVIYQLLFMYFHQRKAALHDALREVTGAHGPRTFGRGHLHVWREVPCT